ncbi:MAG: amino acid ABC transporter ATP-binding protein [Erysipelotrichaceae bacterium]|nr:amino acid ABC transporter ATP-binding protein [Erysipelotrichaceae bacterium]
MSLLEIRNLGKTFAEKKILRDISFDLNKGETLSIIGSSGSGKTTLLRCINLLEMADEGQILLNGEVIYGAMKRNGMKEDEIAKIRRHFGLVFQQFNLFPQYTALQNVTLASKLKGIDNTEKALNLLEQMGLSDRIDYYPHQLSGGQQQRVAIARALALEPDVLCFDEPTSALDPMLTNEVLKVIQDLARKKMTMIVVTHEISFARQVSDRVIYMDDGEIVEAGTSREVIDSPKDERTRKFLSSIIYE